MAQRNQYIQDAEQKGSRLGNRKRAQDEGETEDEGDEDLGYGEGNNG